MDDVTDEETLDEDFNNLQTCKIVRQFKPDGIMKRFAGKVHQLAKSKNGELPKSSTGDGENGGKRQINIFISYCWHSRKEAVHEMARHLMEQPDFKVWIDMDSMSGYTYESMAKGLDEADIVIVFFGQEYADSPNCRREIEYAANKNKEILPIRVEKGYRPDGWLLFIFKSQLRFDFCEDDNFHESAVKICEHIRSCQAISGNVKRETRSNQAKSSVNFRSVGAPFFSKSKYFSRPEDEQRILNQIKNVAENPDDGCLIVSGDGGVGKTTLVARLLTDEKNHSFFVQDCNFHRAIWINCFDWREVFDEKAFVDKIVILAKELEDSDRSANFSNLQGIASYFKRKNLRLAYILDDMFNYRLIQSFLEKLTDPPICFVVTRDAQSIIETNFGMVQKVERVEELTDEGIKEMLRTTFKLNKFLMEDQLYKLAALCCGLPLIASLIAARISNCETMDEARSEYKVLVVKQKISELKTQNRSFKTVSNLFTFSLDQMDASLRTLYYAFLLFNPAEPVSIFDLGVLWGFDLDEDSRCGLRGVCRAFEKRSLVRRVKKAVQDNTEQDSPSKNEDLEENVFDDASEDRFLLHQMLYEAAHDKARREYKLTNMPEDESLALIRMKIVSGEMGSADFGDGQNDDSGLGVLLGAIKFHRRLLFERIINKLNSKSLSSFCMKKSRHTNGMTFLHYLYHYKWEKKNKKLPVELMMIGAGSMMHFNPSYRIIKRIILKIMEHGNEDLLWKVVSERQTGKRRSLLFEILDDAKDQKHLLDRIPLVARVSHWFIHYAELKWEETLYEKQETHPLILASYEGDKARVDHLASETDDRKILGEAFITAARRGHLEIVKSLCTKFPEGIDAKDEEGRIALTVAAKNGHLDTVKFLVEKKPESVETVDSNQRSPILWAAKNGHLDCVKYFMEKGPETAKLQDSEGLDPLMAASGDGRLEVVRLLCEMCPGLLDSRTHSQDRSAFVFAATNGRIEVMKVLYDKFEQKDRVKALTLAAAVGQLGAVKYLLEKDPDVGSKNDPEFKVPAIMLAASGGHVDVVEALYGKSQTVSEIMGQKISAMMLAATSGHLEVVQFLHFKEPEVSKLTSSDGESAMTIAGKMGHRDVVQFFQDNNVTNSDQAQ